jgi:septal ring factor EnvC (AmiA/AmiB activator)
MRELGKRNRGFAQSGKMFVPLLGFLTVVAVGVAGTAVWFQMQERDKRRSAEQQLQLIQAEMNDVKVRLDDTQQAKTRAEGELAKVRQELSQTQEQLAQAVAAQETLTRSIEDREREIGRVTKELEQIRAQERTATAQLFEIQGERDTLRQQLAGLERAKEDLETKVTELTSQSTVELDKVMVGQGQMPSLAMGDPSASSQSEKPLPSGQVVVINREYDFIVMNLGKTQGLSVGQEFQIVRGDQVLGRVKVERVYEELSAAAILPDSKKDRIREGDTVKAL